MNNARNGGGKGEREAYLKPGLKPEREPEEGSEGRLEERSEEELKEELKEEREGELKREPKEASKWKMSLSGFDGEVEYHESIPSTQLRARELAQAGALRAVVVADRQTKGRGRMARQWESPKGGRYFSILFRPALALASAYLVNVAAALAVAEAVQSLLNLELRLKWPNDLLLPGDWPSDGGFAHVIAGERKVCGILSESATRNGTLDYCITGIGINLREPPRLSPEVAERGGWLSQGSPKADREVDRKELLSRVVAAFFKWIDGMEREGTAPMLEVYRERCVSIGRAVRVETDAETLTGTCLNIGDDGELVVETPLGTRYFHVGDITHARLA